MPTTDGPQTLPVGVATAIPDPNQAGGNPSAAVQIQNSSPYQLNVIAAGDQLSIQPFFAQTVEITGAPTTVTPLAVAGVAAACVITFSFLLGTAPGTGIMLPDGTGWVEPPPQQDGPLTAAAIAAALATQSIVDPLGGGLQAFTSSAAILSTGPFTALHSYNTLLLNFYNGVAGGDVFTAQASRRQSGIDFYNYPWQSQPCSALQPVGASSITMLLPCAFAAGDLIDVWVKSSPNRSTTWGLYGITTALTPQVVTPIGYPLGTAPRGGVLRAPPGIWPAAGSSVALLSAPPAGACYRLHSAFTDTATTGYLLESGTTVIGYVNGANNSSIIDGQICLGALTAQTHVLTGGGSCYVTYDTIPTPTIS